MLAGEKTEAPTSRRRRDVRRKGQTARSQELTSAIALLAALLALKLFLSSMQSQLTRMVTVGVAAVGQPASNQIPWTVTSVGATLAGLLLPLFMLVLVAAIAGSLVQGSVVFAPQALGPKGERISPLAGAKRIFSVRGAMTTGKTLAKFLVVAGVAGLIVYENLAQLSVLGTLPMASAVQLIASLAWEILFKCALALLGVGAMDWTWERRRFLQSIRMTKQEVKEEFRQSEGDPQVRLRLRQKREQLMQQMLKNVRTADVVITNPTHVAVALKYDGASMGAPVVVAKGQDYFAQRLREAAAEAAVPILENPPLARSLYRLVPVGGSIPAELYLAVAELLAWVYRMRGRGPAVAS